jgi:protein-L-isoaspartate(D-aspartate) O-methyltransferase
MIDSQLRTSGVNQEFVLARMSSLAREDYVPEAAKTMAYMDRAIPLGKGRFLSSPLVHGMMLAEAAPKADDRVLVVEGGTSYLADLARPLVHRLDSIGAGEVAAKAGKRGSYSLMIIDGAIEQLPDSLAKYLGEGGRVVTGLVLRGVTRIAAGRKIAGSVALQPLAEIGIPVLHEFDKPKAWSF